MIRRTLLGSLLAVVLSSSVGAVGFDRSAKPPVAKRIPHPMALHGVERQDDYYWLRDRSDPDVLQYLTAENDYQTKVMAPTAALREQLFQEMKGRIKETDLSVPEKLGGYFYYSRTEEGKQYKIHCRKAGSLGAAEQVVIDENAMAEGHEYFALGLYEPSRCHRYLLYGCDTTGGEHYEIRIRDMTTGRDLADVIPHTCGDAVWSADASVVFYVVPNDAERPYRAMRHVVGTAPSADVLVYEEKDEAFSVGLSRTKDWSWLLMSSSTSTSDEVRWLDASKPLGEFSLFAKRRPKVEYSLVRHGDDVYVLTNDGAVNFKAYVAPARAPERRNWRVFLPHRPAVKLDGMDVFRDYLVLYERAAAVKTIRYYDFATGRFHAVEFPESTYTYYTADNDEYDTTLLRFTYTSFLTPDSVYDFDMATGTRELKKRREVLGGYDPAMYASERLWAPSHDGTKVPLSIMYRPDLLTKGGNPVYMTGYGAYGDSYDPYFSSNRLSLVDRGFMYAIAQVRGGEDQGRPWYIDGKTFAKMNTFLDFIACGEHLVARGFTRPGRIAIQGGSAGGLLMGAVTNLRPDLWGCVVADVPFVDAVTTMLDPTIPLTVGEYGEWGNPEQQKAFDYILRYSPYDNVTAKAYPPMLVTAGLNDPRVGYWEPAKYVAKMRRMKTDAHVLLLKTNMGAGHGGASGRYDYLKDIAYEFAFVVTALGCAH